jgi:hypothetical protein
VETGETAGPAGDDERTRRGAIAGELQREMGYVVRDQSGGAARFDESGGDQDDDSPRYPEGDAGLHRPDAGSRGRERLRDDDPVLRTDAVGEGHRECWNTTRRREGGSHDLA